MNCFYCYDSDYKALKVDYKVLEIDYYKALGVWLTKQRGRSARRVLDWIHSIDRQLSLNKNKFSEPSIPSYPVHTFALNLMMSLIRTKAFRHSVTRCFGSPVRSTISFSVLKRRRSIVKPTQPSPTLTTDTCLPSGLSRKSRSTASIAFLSS
jgi:hypothetical protein